MIDYFQVKTVCLNPLQFINTYKPIEYANTATGEIKYPYIIRDGPIDVILNRYKDQFSIKLKGSIHKYHNYLNDGKEPYYNYNDFSLSQIKEVVHKLVEVYPFVSSGDIQVLEFGFNLNVSFDPRLMIDKGLLHHRGSIHSKQNDYRSTGMFKEFDCRDFWLKIYDKGKHFSLDQNILRIEIKLRNKRAINKRGIKHISDFYNIEVLESLFKYLLDQVEHLCIVDQIEPLETFRTDELKIWNIYTSYQRIQAQKVTRQAKSKRLAKFKLILEKYNLNKYKKEIILHLESKFKELKQVDVFNSLETLNKNTDPIGQNDDRLTFSSKNIRCICQLPIFPLNEPIPKKRYSKRKIVPSFDLYEVKKKRNDISNVSHNLIRSINSKVKRLEKLDRTDMIPKIKLNDNQKCILRELSHLEQWRQLLMKLQII